MSKHTGGIWEVLYGSEILSNENNAFVAETNFNIVNGKGSRKATREETANAEFIVRACNSHDELLEACKEMLEEYIADLRENGVTDGNYFSHLLENAIRKAEAK